MEQRPSKYKAVAVTKKIYDCELVMRDVDRIASGRCVCFDTLWEPVRRRARKVGSGSLGGVRRGACAFGCSPGKAEPKPRSPKGGQQKTQHSKASTAAKGAARPWRVSRGREYEVQSL